MKNESFWQTGWGLALRAVAFTFLFLLIFILITVGTIGFFAYQKAQAFAAASGTPLPQLITTARNGWYREPKHTNGRINVLVLGTDEVANRGNAPVLTDTLMIASVNLDTGAISLFSFPRDLWHVEYQTRINALYSYGRERYPNEPERFPREVIEDITGVTLHHTFVIRLETLAKLIDAVGGINVNVTEGFVDEEFPRSDVDIRTVHDPKLLYERIEFPTGTQHMNGETVLKYVRSRHAPGDQGTDTARAARQQQVILALVEKIRDPQFLLNPEKMGQLYRFYVDEFGKVISVEEAIAIAKKLWPVKTSLKFHQGSPSIYPDDPLGVIVHPPVTKYQNQWVYEIRDRQAFQQEVQQKLQILPR